MLELVIAACRSIAEFWPIVCALVALTLFWFSLLVRVGNLEQRVDRLYGRTGKLYDWLDRVERQASETNADEDVPPTSVDVPAPPDKAVVAAAVVADEEDDEDAPTLHAASKGSVPDIAQVIEARRLAQEKRREVVDPAAARVVEFRTIAKTAVKDFAERIRKSVKTAVVEHVEDDVRSTTLYTSRLAYMFEHFGGVTHDFVDYVRVDSNVIVGFAVSLYADPGPVLAVTAKIEQDPERRVVAFEVHEMITYPVDGAYVKALLDRMAEEVL